MKKIRKTRKVRKEKLSDITKDFLNHKLRDRIALRQKEEDNDTEEYEEETTDVTKEEEKNCYLTTDIRNS